MPDITRKTFYDSRDLGDAELLFPLETSHLRKVLQQLIKAGSSFRVHRISGGAWWVIYPAKVLELSTLEKIVGKGRIG